MLRRTIGGFLVLSSEFSFVMEDESRVVGYALAAVSAAEFFKRLDIAWTSELKEKYPLPTTDSENGEKNTRWAETVLNPVVSRDS